MYLIIIIFSVSIGINLFNCGNLITDKISHQILMSNRFNYNKFAWKWYYAHSKRF